MIRRVALKPKRSVERLSHRVVETDGYSIHSEREYGASHETTEDNQADDTGISGWGETLAAGLSNSDGDKPGSAGGPGKE
jgi:hypothetical protein